ncbi:DUF3223 domain-containing protein [Sulfuricella sp.]|uniref:DUF3223 domain-containing protein n=1 Tax=Sulfuricella sp. TaxID=2099377 RepID=UPI002CC7D640|nr:DUF3223 domain-containing protein [Sulfuricella sp.]HUX65419.1 DUF3223 domain-containing protein [Sulfuricella sp.]
MGQAISVTIGEHFFRKKGDLTEFIRALVDRYQIGDFLNAEDTKFCLTLFESHTDYPKKLAPGVARIQLLIQEEGSRGFQIHKTDGTSDNISWTDCVANRK